MLVKNMTDKETSDHILQYIECLDEKGTFSWPTDACGYDQHMRLVQHRNETWNGGTTEEYKKWLKDYANSLVS